jgi:hypothetical protein
MLARIARIFVALRVRQHTSRAEEKVAWERQGLWVFFRLAAGRSDLSRAARIQ